VNSVATGSFGVRACRRDDPADRAGILALIGAVWGTSDEGRAVVRRLAKQWDWRFARNPCADPAFPPALVLEHDGEIVGHLSCMPVRVNVRGAAVTGFWSGEWVTHPSRGRGFGHLLVRSVMAIPAIGLATPNDAAYPALKQLGWSDLCRLENRVRIARPDRVLARTLGEGAFGRAAALAARAAARSLAPGPRAGDARVAIVPLRRFDERFDGLWRRVAPSYSAAVIRDSRFLNWRYVEIPDREYGIAAAERGGETAGYVVFYARRRRGLVFGHVIDLLAAKDDPGARDALLTHAVEELERRGDADVVTCYLSPFDAFLRAGLRRCGFLFARRRGAVLVRDGTRSGSGGPPVQPCEWFLSRGDSDLDMAS
jgi:hypothetical protein